MKGLISQTCCTSDGIMQDADLQTSAEMGFERRSKVCNAWQFERTPDGTLVIML